MIDEYEKDNFRLSGSGLEGDDEPETLEEAEAESELEEDEDEAEIPAFEEEEE